MSELRGPGSNAPGGSLSFSSTYRYDGLGRLRSESLAAPTASGPNPPPNTTYKYYAQGLVFSETTLTFNADSAGYKKNGKWYFSLTDHLGTPRVVFSEDGIVVERNHYYAYGLRHPTWSSTSIGEPEEEGFAGGERTQEDLVVSWQRNGARMYDPVLGRFLGVEPLADAMRTESVYLYAGGDPVNLHDPTGTRKKKKKREVAAEGYEDHAEISDEHAKVENGENGGLSPALLSLLAFFWDSSENGYSRYSFSNGGYRLESYTNNKREIASRKDIIELNWNLAKHDVLGGQDPSAYYEATGNTAKLEEFYTGIIKHEQKWGVELAKTPSGKVNISTFSDFRINSPASIELGNVALNSRFVKNGLFNNPFNLITTVVHELIHIKKYRGLISPGVEEHLNIYFLQYYYDPVALQHTTSEYKGYYKKWVDQSLEDLKIYGGKESYGTWRKRFYNNGSQFVTAIFPRIGI